MESNEKFSNTKNKLINQNSKISNQKENIYDNQVSSRGLFFEKNQKLVSKEKKKKKDSLSCSELLLSGEHESIEKKKIKKTKKEVVKRVIVDDIDNIFTLLKEPKLKLRIQEVLHYFIVFLICIYYWIFLFLTGVKFERNYYFSEYGQLDTASDEQVCDYYENSANIIIYNFSFKYYNFSADPFEFFEEESNTLNSFYRTFFIRYSNLIDEEKLSVTKQQDYITYKPMLSVVITNKEKWNLFFRYFSLCEYGIYYFCMIITLAIGGIFGSLLFGFLSDIYGRRIIILITLLISTICTLIIFILSCRLDIYYRDKLSFFRDKCLSDGINCNDDILPSMYAQEQTKEMFKKLFIYYLTCILFLNFALWPLLKSCMALLVENSKGELEVLINFRRYNLVFQGLPPLFTFFILVTINNFTITFLVLASINLITLILSYIFLDESIRYYYEYCEWENLTKVILNTYKINLDDFKTFNEEEFKEFQKKEYSKCFYKVNSRINNNIKNKSYFVLNQTYYQNCKEARYALNRSIKRNVDFIIKLENIKSYPILIITSLWSNHALKNSKTLLVIILIMLYIILDLFQKELLEPPFFSIQDLYYGSDYNYIINSVLFFYFVVNILSNYFYYCFYRIECFKTVIYISQLFISIALIIYHFLNINVPRTPIDTNQFNLKMLYFFRRDMRPKKNITLIFFSYFALNGVIFYEYLLILKISKTIHRCTFLSLHSVSLIIATVISEFIYYCMQDYFLFLGALNLFCLLTFCFLSEFKELNYIMNDLKVNMFGIRKDNWKEKFKTN